MEAERRFSTWRRRRLGWGCSSDGGDGGSNLELYGRISAAGTSAATLFDKGTGNYTLWSTSQNPHVLRLILSAFVLGIPEHKLRVIAPDVGGGFGSKIFCYADETMVCWAASRVEIGRAHV